jgi:hypothetical protein
MKEGDEHFAAPLLGPCFNVKLRSAGVERIGGHRNAGMAAATGYARQWRYAAEPTHGNHVILVH